MAEVKLNSVGFAYVYFYIRPNNSTTMKHLSYKVDTGANSTTISKKWLNVLGYDDEWIKTGLLLEGDNRPTLAAGRPIDECFLISLPEIHLGGYVGYNWPFLVSMDDEIQFRLLLGTDSLRFFNWVFDYENGVCKFDLIPNMRKLLFNQEEQSIHAIDTM